MASDLPRLALELPDCSCGCHVCHHVHDYHVCHHVRPDYGYRVCHLFCHHVHDYLFFRRGYHDFPENGFLFFPALFSPVPVSSSARLQLLLPHASAEPVDGFCPDVDELAGMVFHLLLLCVHSGIFHFYFHRLNGYLSYHHVQSENGYRVCRHVPDPDAFHPVFHHSGCSAGGIPGRFFSSLVRQIFPLLLFRHLPLVQMLFLPYLLLPRRWYSYVSWLPHPFYSGTQQALCSAYQVLSLTHIF